MKNVLYSIQLVIHSSLNIKSSESLNSNGRYSKAKGHTAIDASYRPRTIIAEGAMAYLSVFCCPEKGEEQVLHPIK